RRWRCHSPTSPSWASPPFLSVSRCVANLGRRGNFGAVRLHNPASLEEWGGDEGVAVDTRSGRRSPIDSLVSGFTKKPVLSPVARHAPGKPPGGLMRRSRGKRERPDKIATRQRLGVRIARRFVGTAARGAVHGTADLLRQ